MPSVTLSPISSICINSSAVALSGGNPAGGLFTGNGVSNGSFDPAIAGIGTHNITYTYTDINGCIASAAQTVTVKTLPIASISASGVTTFCQGGSVILTSTGGSGASYSWSNGATAQSINVTNTGTFTVTVTAANGCSTTSTSQSVTANPLPLAVTGSNQTICNLQSVSIGSSSVAGNTYNWTPSTGLSSSVVSNPTANPSVTTTYTLTETITATGCTKSNTVTVNVNSLPTAVIQTSGNTTFCAGNSLTLTATSASSYNWNNGATSQSITVTTLTGNYSVTVTDANGCNKTSSPVTIVVNPLPIASVGTNKTICVGQSIGIGAAAVSGNTYSWTPSTGLSSDNASDPIANPTATTTYTLTETITATGCQKTNTVTVTVNPVPVATIITSGQTTICQGSSLTLTASNGSSYLWSTNETTQSISVSTSGSYSVTVTNSFNCSTTSAAKAVTVNAPPIATITPSGTTTLCQGENVTLTSSAGFNYLWSTGATTKSITVSNTGSYTVKVIALSGCSTTSSVQTVNVNSISTPTITASGPTTFCNGNNVVLTSSGSTGFTYLWTNGSTEQSITVSTTGTYNVTTTDTNGCSKSATPISVTENPLPTPIITAGGPTTFCQGDFVVLTSSSSAIYNWSTGETTQSITVNSQGTFSVSVTDLNGCSFTSSYESTTVLSLPDSTITPSRPLTFCAGDSVVLTASPGASYLWNNGATDQSIIVKSTGTFDVTVTSSNGCSLTSSTTTVTVNSLPVASISQSGSTNLCVGGTVTLTATAGSSYLWSNGATTQSITESNQSNSYTVTVFDANGCSSTSAPTSVYFNTEFINSGSIVTIKANTTLTAPAVKNFSNGTFDNTGLINITTCHWTNSAGNAAFVNNSPGTVQFTGGNQNIQGTSVTDFYNLTLLGTGVKSLLVDAISINTLNLNDIELSTSNNTMFVTNSSASAITRTTGFVSSTGTGSLSRATLSTSPYLYPVGSSLGTVRYRPIEITPNSSSAQIYTVRLANVDVSSEGFNRSTKDTTICKINPDFYHRINRTLGSSSADLTTYFDQSSDGNYSAVTHWQNAPQWEVTSTPTNISNYGLTGLTVSSWNDFSYTAFALGTSLSTQVTITANGPTTLCQGGSVGLTASAGTSYIWSTGETTQTITALATGNYSVTVTDINSCSTPANSTASVQVIVNNLPTASISGGTIFCQSGVLTASGGVNYLWNTGETTSNITVTTSGNYSVTVTDANGCNSNSSSSITVNSLPSVIATAAGVKVVLLL